MSSIGWVVLRPLRPAAPTVEEVTCAPTEGIARVLQPSRLAVQAKDELASSQAANVETAENAEPLCGPTLPVGCHVVDNNIDGGVISSDEDAAAPLIEDVDDQRSRSRSPRHLGRTAVRTETGDTSSCIDLDADPDPHFYVERAPAGAGCCAVCKQFITVGQQRFGFCWHSAASASVASAEWVHSPRCVRKVNFEVHVEQRVAFDADIEPFEKSRVLEELVAKHAHQKEIVWKGKSAAASESVVPWRLGERSWVVVAVTSRGSSSSSSLTSYPVLAELTALQEARACGAI